MRPARRNDLLVTGGLFLFASVCLALAAFGCGHKPPDQTPLVLSTNGTGTVYEVPVDQVKEKEIGATPGKDIDDVIMEIIVPPSDKPTSLKVHKRPKPLAKQLTEAVTGDTGNPDYALTSNNKDVQGKTEKHTGLWPYLAGAFTLIGGIIAARNWLKRFSWITKIISVLRKLTGF